MEYELDDAQKRHSDNPSTFDVPLQEELDSAAVPGAFVKLLFHCDREGERHSERMWVEIQKRTEEGFYGILKNDPMSFPPDVLKYGDPVRFKKCHITDVSRPGQVD